MSLSALTRKAARSWRGTFALAALISATGAFSCRPRQTAQLPVSVPILMYHDLSEARDPATANDVWKVQVDAFERHLQFLRQQGYTSVLPQDLARAAQGRGPLPDKPVVITFDDGFLSSLTHAEPLLRRYGFQGIVYLITERIADDAGQRLHYRATPCLTWPEVRTMMQRGIITFGVHSHTHPRHPSETEAELLFSRDLFRARTGRRPDSFCYPHGQYHDSLVRAVAAAGFSTAMICDDDIAVIDHDTNMFTLPRISVFGGIQHYVVDKLPAAVTGPDRVGVRVHNPGRPVRVAPRLLGADLPPDRQWLPETRLESAPQDWVWPVAPTVDHDNLRLEIWDRNRVLLLYAVP
ncbi:MAG: polysaccharide deacetylase family protein [Kiritimatiellia bacterium]|nr:polysaccharide deacetylase family protein [Lentisphaerota bacterium]